MFVNFIDFDLDIRMVELFISVICTWYFCNLVDWLLHTMSHIPTKIPILKTIHQIHMTHHKQHYPITKLLRSKPYKSGGGEFAFGPVILVLYTIYTIVKPHYVLYLS